MSVKRISVVSLMTLATLLGVGTTVAAPPGDTPPVGTVQTLRAMTVSLAAGRTGQETKRVVYAPPPGWYVRSHRVIVTGRYGNANYTVSTLPARWDWHADEQAASAGHANGSVALAAYKVAGGGQFAGGKDAMSADHQMVASSHHLLVLDVTARGSGLLQGGSGIELTVVAELVYFGR